MGKVIPFKGITKLDLPVKTTIEGAKKNLAGVVVMGYTHDGKEYFASSYADGGEVLWLLERLKKRLLEIVEEDF